MTRFINAPYSDHHQGADRVDAAMDAAQHPLQSLAGTRGIALLLGSAMVAAVMVVAYEVMDTTTEGHLLVMWMVLWLALFAVLAFFAGTARHISTRLVGSLDAWSRRVAEARADQRLWAIAKADPRVMADLQTAMAHHEVLAEANADAAPASSAQAARAQRALMSERRYL
ncbi:hypothetical protein BH10PSE16_BH10PSE16_33640 [soil metagenome]